MFPDCASHKWGEGCLKSCNCKTSDTVCNISYGCTECEDGWSGGECNDNIDECTANNETICGENSNCTNTHGSYRCDCHEGYEMEAGLCRG